jgi:hypothetical protein
MTTVTTETERTEHEHKHEHGFPLEEVRKEVMVFGNQIHEYFGHLNHVQAEIENYKFVVEKHGEGLDVEIQLKAYVHPKTSEPVRTIPK